MTTNGRPEDKIDLEIERREIKRIVSQSLDYKIRREAIGFSCPKFRELMDENYHVGRVVSLSNSIYNCNSNWAKDGTCFIISGGNRNLREIFSNACLFRFLASNSSLPSPLIENVVMSEVIMQLSNWDKQRFEYANNLKTIPCLLIQEVSIQEHPRDNNDCVFLLDSIFLERIKRRRPTIITLDCFENFSTPRVFGRVFVDILNSDIESEVVKVKLIDKK